MRAAPWSALLLALVAALPRAGGAEPSPSGHWAFQSVSAPVPPSVKGGAWVTNPIDAFIAAAHEQRGLTPSAPAARRVLIRRLSLDLLGLPPTPAEVEAFVNDPAPDAYGRLVERLLASPHYGERWGRHWLDLARWAESEGYESNHPRPTAWRYRDYVVRSFNQDKPHDRFLREQLAGDELTPYAHDNLIATGFLAAARLSSNEEDKALQRNDMLVDIVNATAGSLLGLTLQCAQCHDHKFDPVSATDYYRFQGFFLRGQVANVVLPDPAAQAAYEAAQPPEYAPARKLLQALYDESHARLTATTRQGLAPELLAALDTPGERRTPAQEKLALEADTRLQFLTAQVEKNLRPEDRPLYDELKKKIERIEKQLPERPWTFAFYSPATSPTPVEVLPMKGFYPLPYDPARLARARPYLLEAGDVHQRGGEVEVGWPAVFGPTPADRVKARPRLALAEWLTDPRHPLTARVWANRVWQYHFGRGLVATPSDFGVKGARPSHPELLDWLAAELVRSGWSTKHLHRLIVTSSTYRQASAPHGENARIDAENTYWWRWSPRRLEAEAIRDAWLAATGELDRRQGGPGTPEDDKNLRRTLYLFQKREQTPAVQAQFDGPSAAAESCPKRHVSTVPLQALYLLNNAFAVSRAQALARQVEQTAGADTARQIDTAFRLVLQRGPDEVERSAARRFFARQAPQGASDEARSQALVRFSQALLNLNESLYIE